MSLLISKTQLPLLAGVSNNTVLPSRNLNSNCRPISLAINSSIHGIEHLAIHIILPLNTIMHLQFSCNRGYPLAIVQTCPPLK